MIIHINPHVFLYYLIFINLLAAIVFYSDKRKAIAKKQRTSEAKLHLFELMGGVFIIIPMLYIIRHKNRKSMYFVLTYLILTVWILFLIFAIRYN
jgi:uncharacterized membrane protein YsdA (DUF1294 family)